MPEIMTTTEVPALSTLPSPPQRKLAFVGDAVTPRDTRVGEERSFVGSFDWDIPTLPPPPPLPTIPAPLDTLFPSPLSDAAWQVRLVLLGSAKLAEEDANLVAERFQALLDSLLEEVGETYQGEVAAKIASLGAGNRLRGKAIPGMKDLEAMPHPPTCVMESLPSFMVVAGNAPVSSDTLRAALESETFPSIFAVPTDYCGVKVSEIVIA